MIKTVTINNFTDLIEYLRTSDLDSRQTEQVINQGLKVWFIHEHSKEALIDMIVEHWSKWSKEKEKPLFADMDPLDVLE